MMSELLQWIAKGEGVRQDFKHSIDDKTKIARTLAAFANTEGGRLLIGVKDNGKIKGVNPEEEFYMIEGAASSFCQPEVIFKGSVWEEGHHRVLLIEVEKSTHKHKAKDEEGKWRFYTRVEDHTLKTNKILEQVWKWDHAKDERKADFDEGALTVLKLIRENQPVTISRLYKLSGFNYRKVDKILALLVYWNVVKMNMSEAGTHYEIPED